MCPGQLLLLPPPHRRQGSPGSVSASVVPLGHVPPAEQPQIWALVQVGAVDPPPAAHLDHPGEVGVGPQEGLPPSLVSAPPQGPPGSCGGTPAGSPHVHTRKRSARGVSSGPLRGLEGLPWRASCSLSRVPAGSSSCHLWDTGTCRCGRPFPCAFMIFCQLLVLFYLLKA